MATKQKGDFSRKEVYQFVIDYVDCPLFNTLEDCATSYNISTRIAKQLIYRAVAECIVEDNIVDILCNKAYQSAFQHACQEQIHKAPHSAYVKYEQLKKVRQSFCLTDEQSVEIVILYIASPLNKKLFCEENAITRALFDRTLKIAIIHRLISDDMVEDLREKALYTSSSTSSVNSLFESLKLARANYQQ